MEQNTELTKSKSTPQVKPKLSQLPFPHHFSILFPLINLPAEHTITGIEYDLEIQIIHESVEGNMKNMAILSIIFESQPGKNSLELTNWNLLNLPNPGIPSVVDFFEGPLNVMKFIFGQDQYSSPPPFSYYKYMGSMTSPPCMENVVWFIYEKPVGQGSTVLSMLRDALNAPGVTSHDKKPNYDGSNRL
jgi:carbonic anhydrase